MGRNSGSYGDRAAVMDSDPIGSIVSSWSAEDVSDWMTDLGHAVYVEAFVSNGVDGPTLRSLVEQDLQQSLGVDHLGHRKQIMKAIDALVGVGFNASHARSTKMRGTVQRLVGECADKKRPPMPGGNGSDRTRLGPSVLMSLITRTTQAAKRYRVTTLNRPTSQNYIPEEDGEEEARAN